MHILSVRIELVTSPSPILQDEFIKLFRVGEKWYNKVPRDLTPFLVLDFLLEFLVATVFTRLQLFTGYLC